ncbi:LuxR family transcriptional regulator [Haloferula helveola]|uniref:LuxR family transcriptional regulator n=1 Tax=Haloferula helveola TaxID=490095 RepID=A0ABN6H0G9_9BACT|nr:LuxR family transcriptional regulator [Haloferula helveola]
MLGKAYFQLSNSLQSARSFSEVATLLSKDLPPLIGADSCVLSESCSHGKILNIYGQGRVADTGRERLDDLNRLYGEHPLLDKVVQQDPGELGVASSDFVDPEEYANLEFNKILHEGRPMLEALFGKLATCCRKTTLLIAYKRDGIFNSENREVFDAVLFIARAVLERIGSQSVEHAVRNFLLTTSAGAPVAIFIVQLNSEKEIMPLSYEAVRQAEKWWALDEAFRIMPEEAYMAHRMELMDAWTDPVTAQFKQIQIDLGGGVMPCYAMPKANGEIILIMPVSGSLPSGDEALKAILTRRQREIMEWIAEGKTSAEAAIILDISPRTVEKHLEAVFQRLGVENRIAAVRRFLDLKGGQPA